MGKRGPRPMPTVFRLITNDRPGRINKEEAQPDRAPPPCPDWLPPAAAAKWKEVAPRLEAAGLLTEIDGDALAAYCTAFARFVQAEQDAQKFSDMDPTTHGIMARTSNGTPILNPLMGALATLRRDVARMAAELGMTPAGRTQIKVDRPAGASKIEKKYRS